MGLAGSIAGLDRPTSGSLKIDGVELSTLSASKLATWRSHYVGYFFHLPGGAFALLHAEASRSGGAGLLVGHHRHAVVSVERLDEARRPRSELSSAVEYQD